MPDAMMINRRTVLGGLAAATLAAGAGSLINLPPALASSDPAGRLSAGLRIGFRTGTRARLAVLEADAGLAAEPTDRSFRDRTEDRLRRLERLRGIRPGGQHGDPWRVWVSDRLTAVEAFLPVPLRFPFYTHLPLETPAAEYGPLMRERIRDGSCNGIFMYENEWTPLAPDGYLDSITNSGPPVPILMSPKNVSDPVKLKAWMDYWAARPAWIPYVRVAFWQEFQDNFGELLQPPVSDWHRGVITLADAADQVGIASVAHAGTWNLHPSEPQGGIPRLLEFLQPVIHRLGGGITWSLFVFAERETEANTYLGWMNDFMAAYFPYALYGVTAYGDALPPAMPPNDPRRLARAERIASMYADLDDSRARYGGYFAVRDSQNPLWSFWDDFVSDEAAEALEDLGEGLRSERLRVLDRQVHRAAERAALAAGAAPG